ncbi:MAG TPA: CapA family protein [Bellilinea sp.]|nr:CapA family protein [Bellilinea sp.]
MRRSLLGILIVVIGLTACAPQPTSRSIGTIVRSATTVPSQVVEIGPTEKAATPQASLSVQDLTVFAEAGVPSLLLNEINRLPAANDPTTAVLKFGQTEAADASVNWIYALAAPFSSLIDEMSLESLKSAWQGVSPAPDIYVEKSTFEVMTGILGKAATNVKSLPAGELLAAAWDTPDAMAIIPFEELEPRWKVISIDGQSPVHNNFLSDAYPLKAWFGWQGDANALAALQIGMESGEIPAFTDNRDPARLTVLVMTGVTALVRATAVKMEEKGMTYPGEAVRDWLVNADLTHISNEVSFTPVCPDPVSYPGPLIFCSKAEYIELLDDVGTDIIELTGNHGVDWGRDALAYSLDQYRKRGWAYYAAGEDVFKAREAVTVEHNGNKLAFIGCNPAGPEFIWATETQSGVANCDYPWMWQRIKELTADGYLVIATFQYFETYRHYVEPFEEHDFRSMVDAGAVIVSGSQAHHPMAMEFYQGSFIHYGLGNLFFDQMHKGGLIPDATRKEFLDRYVFYNGQHISTELLTAMLEDYARPRPMTAEERHDFLTEIFAVTRWGDVP